MYRVLRWIGGLLIGVAIGVGLMLVAGRGGDASPGPPPQSAPSAAQTWTCSMHSQIRMDHPDRCPICGMDLVPVSTEGGESGAGKGPDVTLTLGEHGRQMAAVATAEVRRRELSKEIRTVGKVELDETRMAYIAARVDGRVEQVFADFPGTPVRKGEHLVALYSPLLLSSQEEYLQILRWQRERQPSGSPGRDPDLSAAYGRLRLWGITDQQLEELARSGQAKTTLVIYAPMGGTVVEKKVRPGQYVKEGDLLYVIADLSQVWLVVHAYESELSWVRVGQPVEITVESEPGRPIQGTVGFVEPVLNEATRTVRVRVIVDNADRRLKPGMYAQVLLRIPILSDGNPAPTGMEGKYVCPMHPYVAAEQPGQCRVCGMPLEQVPANPVSVPGPEGPGVLAVPAEAVLTTGQRWLVYVEDRPGQYRLVEPTLGPRAGDYYPVLAGLKEGDRVVARGNFLLDSQFQITGKPSLLYSEGAAGSAVAHAGHGAAATDRAPAEARPPAAPEAAHAPESQVFSEQELANLNRLAPEERAAAMRQEVCPISGQKLGSMGVPFKMTVGGRLVFLCCQGCEAEVREDPEAVLEKLDVSVRRRAGGG